MTTIFTTHNLREACKLVTRMAILLDGCIEQTDHPEDVFAMPMNERVADFLENSID